MSYEAILRTEALRLARKMIKDEIRRRGMRTMDFLPLEITRAARALLYCPEGEEIFTRAKENIAKR